MTLKELLEKNAKARARREHMVVEPKVEEKIEEPKEEILPEVEESEKVEENNQEEAAPVKKAPAKKGRKPANREYMVVEDVEHVND